MSRMDLPFFFFFFSPLEHFRLRGGRAGGGCYPVEGPGEDCERRV